MTLPKQVDPELISKTIDSMMASSSCYRSKSDFEILRLTREAQKLREADAHMGYIILGGIGALCGDLNEMNINLSKARRIADNDVLRCDSVIFANRLGLFAEAREIYPSICTPKSSARIQRVLLSLGLTCGAFMQLSVLLNTYKDLGLELSQGDVGLVERALKTLQEFGVTDEYVRMVIDTAGETLKENQAFNVGLNADVDATVVHLKIMSPVDPVSAADMTFDLAGKLAEKCESLNPAFLVSFGSHQCQ